VISGEGGRTVPAKNLYHDAVVSALKADGWTITDDPLTLTYGGRDLFADLGAERDSIGAEKAGRKIAVEIQSFVSPSPVRDLQEAVGQYEVYRAVLAEMQPGRVLYLAVPYQVYDGLLAEKLGQLIVARLRLQLLVFDRRKETVVKWID
jgi:hypothetical protein